MNSVRDTKMPDIATRVVAQLQANGHASSVKETSNWEAIIEIITAEDEDPYRFCMRKGSGKCPHLSLGYRQKLSSKHDLDKAIEDVVSGLIQMIESEQRRRIQQKANDQIMPQLLEAKRRLEEEEHVSTITTEHYGIVSLVISGYDGYDFAQVDFTGYRLPTDPEQAVQAVRLIKQASERIIEIRDHLTRSILALSHTGNKDEVVQK